METRVKELLAEAGTIVDSAMGERLAQHAALIREWNDFASLASVRDAGERLWAHVADSLSLTPYVPEEGLLLDIGSGGGFPVVPLKIVRPGLDVVLVERSSRKVGFLRKAIGALGLEGVTLIEGEFPVCCRDLRPDVVTARAVEKGDKVLGQITKFLPAGARFLCQSGDPRAKVREMFHVEHMEDAWSREGLRRGDLYIVTRRTESGPIQ